jgi:molybdopterin-guanine dinucleotide biosynthesis protein A
MGVPKATLTFHGNALLATVVEAIRPACQPILVVAPEDAPLPPLAEIVRVRDAVTREGPLLALAAALPEVRSEAFFLTGCDTPWVSAGLVDRLAAFRGNAEAAVVTDAAGHENWLASVVATAAARAVLAAFPRERSLRSLFARLRVVTVIDDAAARDLDTPDDLAAAEPAGSKLR